MIMAILFWLLVILSSSYAIVYGGKTGRAASFLVIAASILTVAAANAGPNWHKTEMARFAVDLILLVGLYVLSLKSSRFWPIWMTGFHLIAVVTHLSTLIDPAFTPKIYRAMQSLWAIPVLVSMIFGVRADRREARAAKLKSKPQNGQTG